MVELVSLALPSVPEILDVTDRNVVRPLREISRIQAAWAEQVHPMPRRLEDQHHQRGPEVPIGALQLDSAP